jgi:hypothetical protein
MSRVPDYIPGLPCPECRMNGRGGGARIGNKRNACTTCNNFAQNVMRLTRTKLKSLHEAEYYALRLQAEASLYPHVLKRFIEQHPESADKLEKLGEEYGR